MQASLNVLKCAVLALGLSGCETFALNAPTPAQVEQDSTKLAKSTNVVVLVRTQQAANTLQINASRRGYQLNERTDMESLELIMLDFERPAGVSGDIAISDMKTMEPSATAGLDHLYTIQSEAAPRQSAPLPVATPRLYARSMLAWPETGCEAQISIGMIDGDVDATSPALRDTQIIAQDFSDGKAGATRHGTAIADLLVGHGGLQGASLYSASVVADGESNQVGAGVLELVRAIAWMQSSDVQIVNISLAGPYNAILDRVVQRAASKGMIMIAAVGNDGPDALPRYPAAFNDVIAVTAIDRSQRIYNRAVRGNHVDFSAPGVDVFIYDGAQSQYLTGTSLAAPFVTALIASDTRLSAEDNATTIKTRIGSGAVDLGPSGNDPVFGRGLVRSAGNCKTPG